MTFGKRHGPAEGHVSGDAVDAGNEDVEGQSLTSPPSADEAAPARARRAPATDDDVEGHIMVHAQDDEQETI
jgi:hypothetical protein